MLTLLLLATVISLSLLFFKCILRVLVLIYLHNAQCWRVLFLFLLFGIFVRVLLLSILDAWASYKRDCAGVYFFDEISVAEFCVVNFPSSSQVFFFFYFFSSWFCLIVSASNIPKYEEFSFSSSVPGLVILCLSLFLCSLFSLSVRHIFRCQISFHYTDYIFFILCSIISFYCFGIVINIYHIFPVKFFQCEVFIAMIL